MVICNPSTGRSLILPRVKCKTIFVFSYYGYDPIGKHFKVLSVECCRANNSLIFVEYRVLTLGGGKRLSWRKVECPILHDPCYKSIFINGVLYYLAESTGSSVDSIVVCFDLRTEKFTFLETFNRSLLGSTIMVNYNGKLGLLMPKDSRRVDRSIKSLEMWVLRDTAKHEWSKYVYVLPPSWKNVVSETMCIAGMVGTNEIVFSCGFQRAGTASYVIYYNVERKTITKIGIQGMEAFQDKSFNTYLNYVENLELLLTETSVV